MSWLNRFFSVLACVKAINKLLFIRIVGINFNQFCCFCFWKITVVFSLIKYRNYTTAEMTWICCTIAYPAEQMISSSKCMPLLVKSAKKQEILQYWFNQLIYHILFTHFHFQQMKKKEKKKTKFLLQMNKSQLNDDDKKNK